jgi:hypothetical protein
MQYKHHAMHCIILYKPSGLEAVTHHSVAVCAANARVISDIYFPGKRIVSRPVWDIQKGGQGCEGLGAALGHHRKAYDKELMKGTDKKKKIHS